MTKTRYILRLLSDYEPPRFERNDRPEQVWICKKNGKIWQQCVSWVEISEEQLERMEKEAEEKYNHARKK